MNKSKVFKKELSQIKTIPVYNFAVAAIEKLPDYFFVTAASSTGKYHPTYALGTGGLVRHTKAAVKIAQQMLELEQYKNAFEDTERDLMAVALILHDGLKHGLNGSKYTVADHPVVMAEFIKNDAELKEMLTAEELDFLTGCIASHMGQYNTDYRSDKEIMPKPETEAQQLVHLCDWLASRKWLNVDFEDDQYDGIFKEDIVVKEIANQIIGICKQAVAQGYDKEKLYSIIENATGDRNPLKVKDYSALSTALVSINNALNTKGDE